MKKPFPDWYRRLDPLLDGYKTNAIWEAFYERRNNHSKRMFRRTKLKGSMSPGYIFASILLALVTVVLFIWIGCCGLLPLFLLLPLLQMGTVKKTITGAWLPFDLRRVFGSSGVLESAAIDIWQTGASGRTIFEALYIEQRASQWLSGMVVLGILWTIVMTIYCLTGQPLTIHGVILILAISWFTYEVYLATLVSQISTVGERYIKIRIEGWKDENKTAEVIGRGLAKFGIGVAALLGVIVLVLVIGFIVTFIISAIQDAGFEIDHDSYIVVNAGHLIAIGILLVLSLAFRLPRNWFRKRHLEKVRKLLDEGDLAFNVLMAGTVMKDPDGAAWARWRYGNIYSVQPPELPLQTPQEIETTPDDL